MLQLSGSGCTAAHLTRQRISWSAHLQPSSKRVVQRPAQQDSATDANVQVLQSFFIGRAFAITLSRRLGEAVVEVVSEVSKVIAENPKRVQEFQDEVMALARQEMQESNVTAIQLPSSSGSSSRSAAVGSTSSSSAGSSGGGLTSAPQDLEAIVDDLRAEIASSRAELQQVRAAAQASAELN